MTTRPFHIGDILSVTTGCLLSPRRMDGVRDILNFMSGESLMTHQLGRVADECTPFLLEQHPQLALVNTDDVAPENARQRLAEWVKQFGETLSVTPLTKDQHERIDPISEMAETIHPDRIVIISPE